MVAPKAEGVFQGHPFRGADLTPLGLPNHAPEKFKDFMDKTISEYTVTGVVAPWSSVAHTHLHPRPPMVQRLGVEPHKPRATYDARYDNLMMRDCPFSMNGVGKIAQCAWKDAFQMKCDHKAGFHNVPLAEESWPSSSVSNGGGRIACSPRCALDGKSRLSSTTRCRKSSVAGYLCTQG